MRFLPQTEPDRKEMLAKIGVASIDALYGDVPKGKLLAKPVAGPGEPLHVGEQSPAPLRPPRAPPTNLVP